MGSAVKNVSVVFNSFCLIAAIGSISVAAFAVDYARDNELAVALLVLSPILTILTFLGYFAISRENVYALEAYAALMLITTICYTVFAFGFALDVQVKTGLWDELHSAFDDTNRYNTNILTFYESQLHCCGLNGPQDYFITHRNISSSCYAGGIEDMNHLYVMGCLERTESEYYMTSGLMAMFTWVTLCAEIFTLGGIYFLIKQIRGEKNRTDYDILK